MVRRDIPSTEQPLRLTEPSPAGRIPAAIRSNVLLPEPFGPTMHVIRSLPSCRSDMESDHALSS
jgi:hypothetical protein